MELANLLSSTVGMVVGMIIMGVVWYMKGRGPKPVAYKSLTPAQIQAIRDQQVRRALQEAAQNGDTSWRYVSGVRKNGLPFFIVLRPSDIGFFLGSPDGSMLDRQGVVTLEEGNYAPWFLHGAILCQVTQIGFDNDPWFPKIQVEVLRKLLPSWIRTHAAAMAASQGTMMEVERMVESSSHGTLIGSPGVREEHQTEISVGQPVEPPPDEEGNLRRPVLLPGRHRS